MPARVRIDLGVLVMTVMLAGCKRPPADIEQPEATQPGTQGSGASTIVWPPGEQASRTSPERLCDHVIELMLIELGPEAESIADQELVELRSNCIHEAQQERVRIGEAAFAEQAECVLAASSFDALDRCDDDGGGSSSVASNRDVCLHVMDIMKRQFGSVEGAAEPSPEELEMYTEKCVMDLEAERERIGDAKFDAQVRCVMETQTMDDLIRCDDEGP